MLIRKRAKQSEIASNYVKAVGEEDISYSGYLDSTDIGNSHWDEKGSSERYNVWLLRTLDATTLYSSIIVVHAQFNLGICRYKTGGHVFSSMHNGTS